jgi:rhodanese-related sulfurtransferase
MNPAEVAGRLDEVQLVDVREQDEWDAGHIERARHVPMGELGARLGEIDRMRPLVAVCRSGARSGRVAKALQQRGFDAHNLDGGMQAWEQEGLPFTASDGSPGTVI